MQTYIRLADKPKVTLSTGGTWTWPSAPSMASFSSRGPNTTAPDVIKPDLTAPGMQVLAGDSPVSDPSVSAPRQLFQAISGTSMASPIVAGMFAILKQAHPDWSPAELRSALMVTADTGVVDEDRRTQAGPFTMGAGLVDPGVVSAAGSAFDPGLVYDADFDDYLGFLCDAAPGFVVAKDAPTCDELHADGVPTTATDLNLPSIGVSALLGSTTVTRTVTNVASTTLTWRATVTAPAGYQVTVSPSTLSIAPGASATFTVTIVNDRQGRARRVDRRLAHLDQWPVRGAQRDRRAEPRGGSTGQRRRHGHSRLGQSSARRSGTRARTPRPRTVWCRRPVSTAR